MKTFCILISLFLTTCFATTAQSVKLPAACKQILNKKFKGWTFADASRVSEANHTEKKHLSQPNLIKGDWNGDGVMDYAVLIKTRRDSARLAMAFVRTKTGYQHFVFEGGDYIGLYKKGEKDYSYDSNQDFVYQNDAIFVGIGECCGSSYIWRKNKFVSVVTSD